MNKDELKYIKENYFADKFGLGQLFEMIEKASNSLVVERGPMPDSEQRELTLRLPIIRISEKMWGKEGTKDREIIQNLLSKIVASGTNLTEKIQYINDFLEDPPVTDDVSEVLSHIVLLDTLTNILRHFNASAAGFAFEGFLAALLSGTQVPAGTAGIQDLIDNDKNPVSLKLLGEKPGDVHGSYRDLVDHFIDPGGFKQDPESSQYVGQAGAAGKMTYVVGLKSFKEAGTEAALTGTDVQSIKFFQFDFTAQHFLESLLSYEKNWKLLLLPKDLTIDPIHKVPATADEAYSPISMDTDEAARWVKGGPGGKTAYMNILNLYDSGYAKELLADVELVARPGRGNKFWLVHPSGDPVKFERLSPGDERWKKQGARTHEGYRSFRESANMLRAALAEGPDKFWELISRTSGYEGSAGETQFIVGSRYYKGKFYDQDGFGYLGQIIIGNAAIRELAENYVDILNDQIFELFSRVEKLSNEINAYFIGGDKGQGIEAARTAGQIERRQREYIKKSEEV
jgi:hypothetical protein